MGQPVLQRSSPAAQASAQASGRAPLGAAKVDSSRVSLAESQWGQVTRSPLRRTSSSERWPHDSQSYSYRGIMNSPGPLARDPGIK